MGPAPSIHLTAQRIGAIGAIVTFAGLVAGPAAIASVSARAPRAMSMATSRTTLAQAPHGLQAAVRAALRPGPTLGGPTEQAELTPADGTASDAAAYDQFGNSVALDRSTAVFGAPGHGAQGAAYAFIDI
jgi:FG-GAP repeat